MPDTTTTTNDENWNVITSMLPNGWREKAKQTGALRRCRNFDSADSLLRVLMIHLLDGCSLRETAVRAKQGGLASVSDVALLKRLKSCGEWFRWIGDELMRTYMPKQPDDVFPGLRVRVIDGTSVSEPGATGSTWRLHYSVTLPSLACDEAHVTQPSVGESFKRFKVLPGDLLVADRGYAHREGIGHVVSAGGDVLVRINLTNVPLENADHSPFDILKHMRNLTTNQIGDWPVWIRDRSKIINGRLCAIRKSVEATERARKKILREAAAKKRQAKAETLEGAAYIFVFTTLDAKVSAAQTLEMYRGRWQIELVFKRLKSLFGVGHLKKFDQAGAKTWLQGKLMSAFLIESLIAAGERFFPWGYPIQKFAASKSLSLARDIVDGSSS